MRSSRRTSRRVRNIVIKYFADHPEAKDGVMRAWYAYHAPHFRVMPDMPLHNFTNSQRESQCVWCGRSREMVRWDELDARCQRRPKEIKSIKDVLREEVAHAMTLAERAQLEVLKLVARMGMSGETLAVLHHTYGHDPEIVASIVSVPPQMMVDYHAVMEVERERSRAAQQKKVL